MSMRLPGEELVSGKEVNVETSQGELLGATSTTADGTHYFTFRGVPYAKPPVGPLRFKSPQEAEPWKGQRDARQFATRCLQEDGGSEDCLYLNIFTPQLGPNSNLPVMVWFHWGAFAFGSADLDPGHIMDLGVVVVSVQYRLNVFGKFSCQGYSMTYKEATREKRGIGTIQRVSRLAKIPGFLSLEGTDVPGNAGLKDQVAALRWINKNINQFGGDADRVTLFGCSAGGSSVHFHILSPLSTGLFHRGISQSGTALDPWAYIEQSQSYAFRLGRNLGLQTEDPQELLDLLRNVPADELEAAVVKLLKPDEKTRYYIFPFLPSLEYSSRTEEPFLAQHPDYIEQHGNFNKTARTTTHTLHCCHWTERNSSHFTLLPLDSEDHSSHFTLLSLNKEEHSSHFTLMSLDREEQSSHFTLLPLEREEQSSHFTLLPLDSEDHSSHFTLLSLDREEHSSHFTLLSLDKEEHSSHFTLMSLDREEQSSHFTLLPLLPLDREEQSSHFTLLPLDSEDHSSHFTLLLLDREKHSLHFTQKEAAITSLSSDTSVPYITGVNKMEGKFSIMSDPTNNDVSQLSYWETINSDLERVVPVDLGLEKGSPESLQVANKVKEFYFGDREISLETKEQWIELQSDILFNVKTQFTVRQFANRSNSTYNYHFTYNNSAHTQEMDYLFYQDKVVGESSRDANIANYIGTLWANFAKTGVPWFQGGVKWEPVSKSRLYYLKIDDKLSLEEELEKERIDFWLDIYNSYQKSGLTFSPVTGRLDGEL
uniref:Carboxylesterase type B domain-containing protein n=1 Tax=Timema bartmani TaxID=61472 RepID=A0A7R9F624_9NEOP|nr:unnamed protein product [Timema bartmani]